MNTAKYHYINPEFIIDMADGDTEFASELALDSMQQIRELIDELIQVAAIADGERVRFCAHKIKGTFLFIGHQASALLAERIEREATTLLHEQLLTLITEIQANYTKAETELLQFIETYAP